MNTLGNRFEDFQFFKTMTVSGNEVKNLNKKRLKELN